ncbi:MAG: TIM barrel protein [Erysipelotrichaceae bacterium]
MKKGLVSVTFRKLEPEEIIQLVKETGLDGIEWGSDIHVPVGNIEKAAHIANLMQANGLETISYGSYYRVGESDNFQLIIDTAKSLKTTNIRVWAGRKNHDQFTPLEKQALINDAKRICEMAKEASMSISFEYHGKTYTNTHASTIDLLSEINMENNYSYWQPLSNASEKEKMENVKQLYQDKKLMNIHIFHWDENNHPFLLSEGKELWANRLKDINCNALLIEFVKEDSIENFYKDAQTLNELVIQHQNINK